jgi:hypothetical protein
MGSSALRLRNGSNFTRNPADFVIILPSLKLSWPKMNVTKINVSVYLMAFQNTDQEINTLK